jgi:hypothetical protein
VTDTCNQSIDDFSARGDDELTLQRGEKIELVELDDGFGDGWYLGKDVKTGVTGLFPGGVWLSPALIVYLVAGIR